MNCNELRWFGGVGAREHKSKVKLLIILYFSRDGTAGSDTGRLWVALNSGSVPLVCGLSVTTVTGGGMTVGLSDASDSASAELSFGVAT